MLGSLILYLKGMRRMMCQLSGFYSKGSWDLVSRIIICVTVLVAIGVTDLRRHSQRFQRLLEKVVFVLTVFSTHAMGA